MDLGALDIQIFVSLVVVLGAAFVALVCDYLKGNNEQLREKNVELRVRSEEREHRWLLDPGTLIPQTLFQQFFAAARLAGWTPEAVVQTAQKAAVNPRRAAAAPPEPSRADLEALRRRADTFDVRADVQKRENVAEPQPVAIRAQRKSVEDFVSPEVMARVATVAAPVLAGVLASEELESTNQSLAAISLATETEEIKEPVVVVSKAIIVSGSNAFGVGDSVRGEIQRLKEQAKAKFASQLGESHSGETLGLPYTHENQENENLGDLVVGLNLNEELLHIGAPGIVGSEEERLSVESAGQLQLEIERVARLEGVQQLVDQRFVDEKPKGPGLIATKYCEEPESFSPPELRFVRVPQELADEKKLQPIVMQPEHSVPDLELLEELRRIATPNNAQPMSSEQGLLDQIIRASVEGSPSVEVPGHSDNEQLLEPAYVNVENSEITDLRGHSLSFAHPTYGNAKDPRAQESEHDAILRELLSQKEKFHSDDAMLDAEIAVESSLELSHAESSLNSGPDHMTASPSEAEPPQSFFQGDAMSLEEAQELSLPPGLHDKGAFAQLIETGKSVSGVVIYAGLNDYAKLTEGKTKPQIDELLHPATKLITSIVRDKDFAARVSEDTWLMVFCGELGNVAQRRIDAVSEKFWDFQLRNLGQMALTFSTGAVQVEKESLADAVAAAKERMEQLRTKGKSNAVNTRKKAVNS